MAGRKIIAGSRGSNLALTQTKSIISQLAAAWPEKTFQIKVIKTEGDKLLASPLALIGGKGVFVKELESALLRGEIDLAVHSLKDLPTEAPAGLMIGAVTKRLDPRDALIKKSARFRRVGTSSLRRKGQLLAKWPRLEVVDLRGNIETRLRKLRESDLDAIVVARAGLERLNITGIRRRLLSLREMLPAPGQGALGIEIRQDDPLLAKLVATVADRVSAIEVAAERSLLQGLGGGCQVPIGAYAKVTGKKLRIKAVVAGRDGKKIVRAELLGDINQPEKLGLKLAERLIKLGAKEMLNER